MALAAQSHMVRCSVGAQHRHQLEGAASHTKQQQDSMQEKTADVPQQPQLLTQVDCMASAAQADCSDGRSFPSVRAQHRWVQLISHSNSQGRGEECMRCDKSMDS